jgi:hypothetical protein
LAFLTSDEFFELKLQRKWVFQQAAKEPHGIKQLTGAEFAPME